MKLIHFLRTLWTLGRGLSTGLDEATESDDPIRLFDAWFAAARRSGMLLPESMTLATSAPDGRPSARLVLLKAFGGDGFVFYTNYTSRKARELDANPRAALAFHWPVLQRQVRIEGPVERVSHAESAAYFASRPRGSQLGAWASEQSAVLPRQDYLQGRFAALTDRFEGKEVPLPDFWGGYRVFPESIEFWQGRSNRLHDRIRFDRRDDGWDTVRLQP